MFRFAKKKGKRLPPFLENAFIAIIMGSFISYNNFIYSDYTRDWHKQLSIIEAIKTSDTIKENSSFLMIDQSREANALGRSYRFYEYTAFLKEALTEEKRFASDYVVSLENITKNKAYPYYHFKDFDLMLAKPQMVVSLVQKQKEPSRLKAIQAMLLWQYFAPDKYLNYLQSLIILEYKPYKDD